MSSRVERFWCSGATCGRWRRTSAGWWCRSVRATLAALSRTFPSSLFEVRRAVLVRARRACRRLDAFPPLHASTVRWSSRSASASTAWHAIIAIGMYVCLSSVCLSVCLSVRSLISKPHVRILPNFLYVRRSSRDKLIQSSLKVKVKASHTRYRALGPELIPVYRQSARRWL